MGKDLERRIEARMEEANEKQIIGKAHTIAKYLGSGGREYSRGVESTEYSFNENGFEIKNSLFLSNDGGGGGGTRVKFEGKVVYNSGDARSGSFVPGVWEEEFNELYKKAAKVKVKEDAKGKLAKTKLKRDEGRRLRKKWGL
jgi:hypothetical protein